MTSSLSSWNSSSPEKSPGNLHPHGKVAWPPSNFITYMSWMFFVYDRCQMIIKPEMILSNLRASYLMRNYDCNLPITCFSFAGSLETEKKKSKVFCQWAKRSIYRNYLTVHHRALHWILCLIHNSYLLLILRFFFVVFCL